MWWCGFALCKASGGRRRRVGGEIDSARDSSMREGDDATRKTMGWGRPGYGRGRPITIPISKPSRYTQESCPTESQGGRMDGGLPSGIHGLCLLGEGRKQLNEAELRLHAFTPRHPVAGALTVSSRFGWSRRPRHRPRGREASDFFLSNPSGYVPVALRDVGSATRLGRLVCPISI